MEDFNLIGFVFRLFKNWRTGKRHFVKDHPEKKGLMQRMGAAGLTIMVIIGQMMGGIHTASAVLWLIATILALIGFILGWPRTKAILTRSPYITPKQKTVRQVNAVAAPHPHDLVEVYHPAQGSLPSRGWRVGTHIALGRSLGMDSTKAWFPHVLVLGATGSGKTSTVLRPTIARWSEAGPACVMSTKGDIIPKVLVGTPGVIHLVTPKGRGYLDADGEERLQALEAAGWKVIDCRWDPVTWAAATKAEPEALRRSEALARCLAGVIAGGRADRSDGRFWSEAASGLITAGILIERAAIIAGASSWLDVLTPADNTTGSDKLFAAATSTAAPGVERLVAELQLTPLSRLADAVSEVPLTLSPVERAAAGEILETAQLLKGNNVTALSRYQTMAAALGAYKYPAESAQPIDVGAWAHSQHDLLVVIVPSNEAETWAAPMAGLALAVWTEASGDPGDHLVVLDEMASLAPVPTIHEWVAQGRSLGVHIVAVLQHEGQARHWSQDAAGWILHNWPLVLVAAGTSAVGLAKHLADGEGQHEVERRSVSTRRDPGAWYGQIEDSTTTSREMRDRIEPNAVFDEAIPGAWRVIDRRVGPWARGI